MKSLVRVLVLLVLVALAPSAQTWAGTVPAAPPTASPVAAPPAPLGEAEFLASLAGLPGEGLMATPCNSNADCPTGKLCCWACGQPDCGKACLTPIRGRCPLFV